MCDVPHKVVCDPLCNLQRDGSKSSKGCDSDEKARKWHDCDCDSNGYLLRHKASVEFSQAINYVNKIKNHFSFEPEKYRKFLEILHNYQNMQRTIEAAYGEIKILFKSAPELLEEFKQFLPRRAFDDGWCENDRDNYKDKNSETPNDNQGLTSKELEFFYKCKQAIKNKQTYNEFLKLLNLYSQNRIKIDTLVNRVEPFFSNSPKLFEWFKSLISYDSNTKQLSDETRDGNSLDSNHDSESSAKISHSYRQPLNKMSRKYSGSDKLCKEVLNDEWISHPIYVSESGFVSHKKTQYEEALYKCEEERYEFDLNIGSNTKTIAVLNSAMDELNALPEEERSSYKFPADFGGTKRFILNRIINKIYSKELGQEVINAIINNPYSAIPVVLRRLKQKNEEWKMAQKEWNKVWRKIDTTNYYKALDYQGANFRVTDRKNMNFRSLILEIEVLYCENKKLKDGPKCDHQLEFYFKDAMIFKTIRKLIRRQLSSLNSENDPQTCKILDMNDSFIFSFFALDANGCPERSEDGLPHTTKITYANNCIYVLFRLYQMLYSRLHKMKELGDKLDAEAESGVTKSKAAIELGLQKMPAGTNKRRRYDCMLHQIKLYIENTIDLNEFEDRMHRLFGISAYIMFTIDKLVSSLVKQIQLVADDQKNTNFMFQYYLIKLKTPKTDHSAKNLKCENNQDNKGDPADHCRLEAESLAQGENLYKIRYHPEECLMTIELLERNDTITKYTSSREEQWAEYVDKFMQKDVSPTAKYKIPFLKRYINSNSSEKFANSSKVCVKSGLEMKICTNTYKLFFVDNTEDVFYRKYFKSAEKCRKKPAIPSEKIFRDWTEAKLLEQRKTDPTIPKSVRSLFNIGEDEHLTIKDIHNEERDKVQFIETKSNKN